MQANGRQVKRRGWAVASGPRSLRRVGRAPCKHPITTPRSSVIWRLALTLLCKAAHPGREGGTHYHGTSSTCVPPSHRGHLMAMLTGKLRHPWGQPKRTRAVSGRGQLLGALRASRSCKSGSVIRPRGRAQGQGRWSSSRRVLGARRPVRGPGLLLPEPLLDELGRR